MCIEGSRLLTDNHKRPSTAPRITSALPGLSVAWPSLGAMDIILIPGFWLDGSSWDEVVPALERAGHRTHALTLPGMESRNADRSGITLRDHVDAVASVIDSLDPDCGKVVLVGHSGGGRSRTPWSTRGPAGSPASIYVDSGPLGRRRRHQRRASGARRRGAPAGLVAVRGRGPGRPRRRAARGLPRARDPHARARGPATRCTFPTNAATTCPSRSSPASSRSELLRKWIEEGHPRVRELAKIRDVALRRPAHRPLAPVHPAGRPQPRDPRQRRPRLIRRRGRGRRGRAAQPVRPGGRGCADDVARGPRRTAGRRQSGR